MAKNLPAVRETWVQSLGQEDPPEKAWQPTPVSVPEKSHGQRILVGGYSPWGRKESDTTEQLTLNLIQPLLLAPSLPSTSNSIALLD